MFPVLTLLVVGSGPDGAGEGAGKGGGEGKEWGRGRGREGEGEFRDHLNYAILFSYALSVLPI